MTARLIRKPEFITKSGGDLPKYVYHYQVVGTIHPSIAENLAKSDLGPVISTAYGTLFRGEVNPNQTAYNNWDVDVEFITRPKAIGTWTWEFDGTGVTDHITHSLETIAVFPSTGNKNAYKNAINWNRGEIQGADVIIPASRFTVTFTHPAGVFSLAYAKYLGDLAGYVNSAPWLVWAAGEVRFLGPRASDGSQTDSQAVYQFDISRNATNLTVGSITGITKAGWHVSWIKSKLTEVTINSEQHPASEPEYVYIERVANTINFATAFGIA